MERIPEKCFKMVLFFFLPAMRNLILFSLLVIEPTVLLLNG